jgi:hypothetical protein
MAGDQRRACPERWFDKLTVRLSLTVLSSAEWTTLSESRRESNGDGKEAALELQ